MAKIKSHRDLISGYDKPKIIDRTLSLVTEVSKMITALRSKLQAF